MVLHVAQVAAFLLVDLRCLHQTLKDRDQRLGGALDLDDLAGELVDAPRDRGAPVEDVVLDLVDVVLDTGDDRRVVVDDAVEDGVDDRERAAAEQIGPRLQLLADAVQVGRLGVADGDDELRAGEDVHLAELDRLGLVDVAGGSKDEEQRVAVTLELGPLVRLHGVLDRELVQLELARDVGEFLRVRAVEADPRDPAPPRQAAFSSDRVSGASVRLPSR